MTRALPVVGHAPAFFADRLGFLLRHSRRADVVEVKLGRARTFLLSDPEDIRHVLVVDHHSFAKNPRLVEPADPTLFGTALVGASKAEHASKRRTLQPVYQQQRLSVYTDVVRRCVSDLADRWRVGSDLDLVEETVALAQEIRIRVLLGADADDAAAVLRAGVALRQRYIARAFVSALPYADRLPSRARSTYRRTRETADDVVLGAIRERRGTGGAADDLLTQLLETRAEDGSTMSDRQAADEARSFLASYEVSSRALAWALYLLAGHPAVQERLWRETQGAPRAGTSGNVLAYPQMVFSEALRLYPPFWLFVRKALADVTLPSGPAVTRGTRLFLSPYAMHRDARRFAQPELFDPERFRPGPELRARPRFAYFPFGGGPHVCIGEGFVRMEAALAITELLRRFELSLAPGKPAIPHPRVTLELRGAPRLRITAR